MDILSLLNGVSPWWWIAFALLLFVAEMLTFTYFVIWIAGAAAALGLIMFAVPEIDGVTQLVLFAVLSILLTFAGRTAIAKWPRVSSEEDTALNQRAARLIGRTGQVTVDFSSGEGMVEIDQIAWRARLNQGSASVGTKLTVTAVDDMTLLCDPV